MATSPGRAVFIAIVAGLVNGCAIKPTHKLTLPSMGTQQEGESLGLDCMAGLPHGKVFLGGAFYRPAGSIRSALCISTDEGKTWKLLSTQFPGCGITKFQTIGPSNIWALVCHAVEGADSPERLLMSSDGGESWKEADMGFARLSGSFHVTHFEFLDLCHGFLSIWSEGTRRGRWFETRDGGNAWRESWKYSLEALAEVETGQGPPTLPLDFCLYAPIYETSPDGAYSKCVGRLRANYSPAFGRYFVDKFLFEDLHIVPEKWERIGSVPFRAQGAGFD